jgi:hypothetical protein
MSAIVVMPSDVLHNAVMLNVIMFCFNKIGVLMLGVNVPNALRLDAIILSVIILYVAWPEKLQPTLTLKSRCTK